MASGGDFKLCMRHSFATLGPHTANCIFRSVKDKDVSCEWTAATSASIMCVSNVYPGGFACEESTMGPASHYFKSYDAGRAADVVSNAFTASAQRVVLAGARTHPAQARPIVHPLCRTDVSLLDRPKKWTAPMNRAVQAGLVAYLRHS